MNEVSVSPDEQFETRIKQLENEVARLTAASDQNSLIEMLLRDNAKRREAEERLSVAQEWIQLAQEVGCAAAYTFDFNKNELTWSASTYALYGWPATKSASVENWLSSVHPEDRSAVEAVANASLSHGKPVRQEFRILRPDGEVRWIQDRGQVLLNEKGQPLRLVGLNVDVTESKLAEEKLNFVVGEVAHRFKNLLAVFQAMVQQSAIDPGIDARTLRDNLLGRISAVARSKELLLRHHMEVVPLTELIADQLFFVTGKKRHAVTSGGPAIDVLPSAAQALGMALHELATNACKHGALVDDKGTVDISWDVNDDRFSFSWAESWPQRKSLKPARKGFGSRITGTFIERAVKGRTESSLDSEGFRWKLTAPLDELRAPQ